MEETDCLQRSERRLFHAVDLHTISARDTLTGAFLLSEADTFISSFRKENLKMKNAQTVQIRTGREAADTTRQLVVLALLSAVGYISMLIIKIPVVSFLSYEPKDIFITLGGFLYGPLAALSCAVVTAVLELFVSKTGIIGMIMNILSSAAFACTASLIYKKRRRLSGAVIGLICAVAAMTATMLLWNYLITPLYMNVSRDAVAGMLTTVFLPFNLLKSGINAALTLLIYRPFIRILKLCGYPVSEHIEDSKVSNLVVYISAALLLGICIFAVIWMNR